MTALAGCLALLCMAAHVQGGDDFPDNLQSLCYARGDSVYGISSNGRLWLLSGRVCREAGVTPVSRSGRWRLRVAGGALFAVSPEGNVYCRRGSGGAWRSMGIGLGAPIQVEAASGFLWLLAVSPRSGRLLVGFSPERGEVARHRIDGYAAFSGSKVLLVDRQGRLMLADGSDKLREIPMPAVWRARAGSFAPYQPLAIVKDRILIGTGRGLYEAYRGKVVLLRDATVVGGAVAATDTSGWVLLKSGGRLSVGRWRPGSLTQLPLPDGAGIDERDAVERLLVTEHGVVVVNWSREQGPIRAVAVTEAGECLRMTRMRPFGTSPATANSVAVAGRLIWFSGASTGFAELPKEDKAGR